jgi:hypothetical protein
MTRPAAHRHYCRSCGARLASDNRSHLCAACDAKDSRQHGPPALPDSFWATDLMRDALATCHIGKVLVAYRNHPLHPAPISQTTVAGWIGAAQPAISRLETGPPVKNLDKLTFWARTLGIPAHLLWFRPLSIQGTRPAPATAAPHELSLQGLDVAYPLSALTTNGLPLLEPAVASPVGVGSMNGLTLRQQADGLLTMFLQLDDELGGDSLYEPLARYVSRLATNAQHDPGDGLPAFGQLSQLTGWLALDANRHAEARRYLTTAVYVANEAHDPALASSALAYMSLQQTYRGDRASALALAQTAFTTGTGSLSPLVETNLATRLARAHAGLGNAAECCQALERARDAFDRAGHDDEPQWVSYVDEIEVEAQAGACYLDLSLITDAVASLHRAISLLEVQAPHRVRDRVHYLARLARCHLADDDIEQACAVGGDALDLSRAIGSARVTERISEFADALAPYGSSVDASEFRQRFAAITAA